MIYTEAIVNTYLRNKLKRAKYSLCRKQFSMAIIPRPKRVD